MLIYKLTDEHGRTQGDTQWDKNVTNYANLNRPPELCSDGVIHVYLSPELAVLLNPIHVNFQTPRLWEAEGDIAASEWMLKAGCRSLTTIKELELPKCDSETRIRFAIFCALSVYKDDHSLNEWAENWLGGHDRTAAAALAAARSVLGAAEASWAARAAAWAAEAARAASWAARAEADFDLHTLAKKAFARS
jgi:hypothetical protein